MKRYSKEFREEAVKLSDEIGVKNAAAQLGLPYYTLADWRQLRKRTRLARYSDKRTGSEGANPAARAREP